MHSVHSASTAYCCGSVAICVTFCLLASHGQPGSTPSLASVSSALSYQGGVKSGIGVDSVSRGTTNQESAMMEKYPETRNAFNDALSKAEEKLG